MKTKFLSLILACVFLSSCSTTYDLVSDGLTGRVPKGGKTYIALPEDGLYKGQAYTSSGFHTAAATAEAVSTYSDPVVAKATESVAGALGSAAYYGCDIMYYIIIENWAPRLAAWSGQPTRVRLNVSAYDVASSRIIVQKTLEVTGRSVTVRSQKAEDLVYRLLNENISSFY